MTKKDNAPKLNEQLCFALYSTSRAVTQAYKALLQPLKLTYPQYVVMMAIWNIKKDMINISDIAATTGLSNATLTPLLNRLISIGYIKKIVAKNDERHKLIQLTYSGKKLAPKAKLASEKALCATGLNDDEVKKLMSLCETIRKNLSS